MLSDIIIDIADNKTEDIVQWGLVGVFRMCYSPSRHLVNPWTQHSANTQNTC